MARQLDSSLGVAEAQIGNRIEIPLGIRALECVVEVEDVWMSHSNTLVSSCLGGPSSFIAANNLSPFLDELTTSLFDVTETPSIRVESTQSTQHYYAPSKRTSDAESAASWTIATNGFKKLEIYRLRSRPTPAAKSKHNSSMPLQATSARCIVR
jgi:hypothetical protein